MRFSVNVRPPLKALATLVFGGSVSCGAYVLDGRLMVTVVVNDRFLSPVWWKTWEGDSNETLFDTFAGKKAALARRRCLFW